MFNWGLIFLIVVLIAALLGFAGLAVAAAGLAKFIFALFMILFLLSMRTGLGSLMDRGGAVASGNKFGRGRSN